MNTGPSEAAQVPLSGRAAEQGTGSQQPKNLAVGSCLVFVLGAGIYGLTTILPLFFQTLLGYDATHAGLSDNPRGRGSIVAAITVGILSTKVDPRVLMLLVLRPSLAPVCGQDF